MSCSGKSSSFCDFQVEAMRRAEYLALPQNVINSLGYCTCFNDLNLILGLTDHALFKELLLKAIKENENA